MGQVLGRVTGADPKAPRGPDAFHRIHVPRAWLEEGLLIEVELPRHLRCANCDGGGCDTCERSGALTVRERGEPPEIVEVRLPQSAGSLTSAARAMVIRIPEFGGLPRPEQRAPRGNLLLAVDAAPQADASVRLLDVPVSLAPAPSHGGVSRKTTRTSPLVLVVTVVVVIWIAFLAWLRLAGIA
jgi:hypothetical protein